MIRKNLCLISRSVYPIHIKDHSQNIITFNGLQEYWDQIHVFAQSKNKAIKKSIFGGIQGVFFPIKKNKYINVLSFTFQGILIISKYHKKNKYEIFQASDAGGAFLALILSRIYKKKFLFEIQGDIFGYPNEVGGMLHSSIVKLSSRYLAKKADFIRIVSPWLNTYLEELKIDPKKIFLVYPRCDPHLFNLQNISPIRPNIFKHSKKNIIFVGNLITSKGIEYLLEAFKIVLSKDKNISLIIVGSGDNENKYKKMVNKLQISENVFFTGRIEHKLIPLYLKSSDLMVLPSIEEGFGRVIIESMSTRTPVVASNVGGIPLIIEDEVNGLLFQTKNSLDLSKKIIRILSDSNLSRRIVEKAYDDFNRKYEFKISMKKYIEMYKDIL